MARTIEFRGNYRAEWFGTLATDTPYHRFRLVAVSSLFAPQARENRLGQNELSRVLRILGTDAQVHLQLVNFYRIVVARVSA